MVAGGCSPLANNGAAGGGGAPWDGSVPGDGSSAADGAVDAGSTDADGNTVDGAGPDVRRLVVVSLNTHSFQEGPDSLAKLQWIGEGLAALGADLVGLNEVMSGTFWAYDYGGAQYDGSQIIKQALESSSGQTWYTASIGFAHWDTGELMSNVVLSRTVIVEAAARSLTTTDFWPAPGEQRNVVYARTEIADLGPVNFFVTHAWGYDSVDTLAQIDEVKGFMAEKFQGNEQLDLLVGDLNTPATWPAYQSWLEAPPFVLIDTVAQGTPALATESTMFGQQARIDYILAGEGWPLSEDPTHYHSTLAFTGEAVDGVVLPVVSDHKGVVTVFTWSP